MSEERVGEVVFLAYSGLDMERIEENEGKNASKKRTEIYEIGVIMGRILRK